MKASLYWPPVQTRRGAAVWENLLRSGHEYELWKQGDVIELRLAAKWTGYNDRAINFCTMLPLATYLACSLSGDTAHDCTGCMTDMPEEVFNALLIMYVEWLLQDKE